MTMNFGQLITAMVTPFNDRLEIDWEATGKLIDYLIEQQSDAIVVSGTTGESPTLTDEEKVRLFRFAVEHAAGRCKVIAGTGSNETAHSVHLTRKALEVGVDGALLVTPYYNKPSQEGVYQHFKTIAEAAESLPIMLYNVPSRTVTSISVETTLRLAQIPNIVATKECASLGQMTEIVKHAPDGFRLYSGDDSITLPTLAVGGYGIVSVASHIVGPRMKALIAAFKAGRVEEAIRINQELYPIFDGLFNCPHPVPNPVPVKVALSLRGLQVGGVRLPLVGATEAETAFIKQLLE